MVISHRKGSSLIGIDHTTAILSWIVRGHAVVYLVAYNVPIGDGNRLIFAPVTVRCDLFAAESVRLSAHPLARVIDYLYEHLSQ